MFLGTYSHTVDTKFRIVLPAKFREGLGERFIITKGLDNCLFVFTMEEFAMLNEKVHALPLTSEKVRKFSRFFFGGAKEAEPDGQGRVFLPPELREFADIKKDVVSIGVSGRVEIWSKENYDMTGVNDKFIDSEILESLDMLGI